MFFSYCVSFIIGVIFFLLRIFLDKTKIVKMVIVKKTLYKSFFFISQRRYLEVIGEFTNDNGVFFFSYFVHKEYCLNFAASFRLSSFLSELIQTLFFEIVCKVWSLAPKRENICSNFVVSIKKFRRSDQFAVI